MEHFTKLTDDYLENLDVRFIRSNKKIVYMNEPCAFDIETSSTYSDDKKVAFMYIWQLGIGVNNTVFYGRTWDDLLDTLEIISEHYSLDEDRRMIVYVHNLGYEFQFMRKYFEWVNVFAVSERKPVKALCSLGIEFRDSYILSGYSLENTAKNLTKHNVKKMVGDLDYSKIRHHLTPLTKKEMLYCENDIHVITAYIDEQIEQYIDISKIPLTNTGRVRQYVKNNCYQESKSHKKTSKTKYIKYRKIMNDLTLNKPQYIQLKRAFMGGFTHSNPDKTNKVLTDVDSVDLTSSYPTVMLSDKFPMSRGKPIEIKSIDHLKSLMVYNCIVFDVAFKNLDNKIGYESYLSDSKCYDTLNKVVNNGRIYKADELSTTITCIDFKIIEQVYSWDNIKISNTVIFRKNYLPKDIIESVLNLYEKKTTLKDVKGSEVEYLLSKGMLNSVYGMCVTDFVKDDHTYVDEWSVDPVDINEKIVDYNKSKSRFLYYPWGVFITAYARRNLWSAIISIGEDYIYSDTDSVKMLNYKKHKPYVENYNINVTKKLSEMMKYYNLDVKRLMPKTIKGVDKPLGVWDYEGHYTHFKTLGAKRYLYKEGEKFVLTVAGLSKQNGVNYMIEKSGGSALDVMDIFDDNLHIPSDKTGKMTHTYLDNENEFMIKDFGGVQTRVETKTGVHLESCDFTLSISKQYGDFLKMLSQGYYYNGIKNI